MASTNIQFCRSLLAVLLKLGSARKRACDTFSLTMIFSLLAIAMGLSPVSASAAGTPRLFGTVGNTVTGGTSTLVELNATDGSLVQTIGAVGYVVNGFDYDPVSGKLYATTAASDLNFPNGLLTINMATGAGSPVGSGHTGFTSVNNVRADPTGNLFAWDGTSRLLAIDPATGGISVVGNSGVSLAAYGASFNSTGTFYLVNYGTTTIYTVNTATGLATSTGHTVGAMAHHGDFNPATDQYWGIDTTGSGAKNIKVIDVSTGSILQTLPTVNNLHTLAFVPEPCAITVTSTADSGAGSLRQAIADVCAGGTIDFDAALSGQTITLTSQLAVAKSLTIDGPTTSPGVSVSGNNAVRVFYVSSGPVTINNLTIQNGRNVPTMPGNIGGAGLLVDSGATVTLNNCAVLNNATGTSPTVGGGIVVNTGAALTMNNCTVSGNSSSFDGGGILNLGTLAVNNSTIVNNSAPGAGGGLETTTNTVTLRNTILTGNSGPSGPDCYTPMQPIQSAGYNLIGSTTGCTVTTGTGDVTGLSYPFMLLGPLQNNGGPTSTYALLAGSPAIDAIPGCNGAPAADQRGITRPKGATCDVGAYEAIPILQTTIDSQPANPVSSASAAFTFSGSGGTGTLGFECQLDGGGFSACTSPKSYAGLSDGSHTFQVRATDSIGTVDATPAGYTWTIDTTAPVITFTSTPTVLTNQSAFSFVFSASETVTGYNCTLLQGATVLIGPIPCSSPVPGSVAGTGTYTFLVSTTDPTGNAGSNSFTWTVDVTPPDTTIQPIGLPTNPTNLMDASFTSTGSDVGSGVAGFQCALDGAAFAPCASPMPQNYTGLSDGSHTFQVRAVDNAGNPDPTPASYTWVVDTAAPLITAFTASRPINTLSIPISAFSASDTVSGVGGYMITTSASQPAPGDAGWSGTAPSMYSVANAGTYTLYPWAKDGLGNVSALYGTPVQVGAYTVLYAAPGGLTSGFCGSWAAACELRYALANAVSGQEIWVAAGTYKPTDTADRTATFQLKPDVALYGGFAGTEPDWSQRNIPANVTILSGDIGAQGDNSDNSYHVVTGANSAVLDGFTITGGNANGSDPFNRGGGMHNNHASPIVSNCTFSGNNASFFGGGMYNYLTSSPALSNCTFSGNSAAIGGGMSNHTSCSPTVTNCTFSGNAASSGGGGMHNISSTPTVANCTFSGNTAPLFAGGGIFNSDGSNATIRNSIFWNVIGGEIQGRGGSTASVSYSVVFNGYSGTGNINADPRLAPLGNYGGDVQTFALLPGSSAIDAGDPATCAATDQRGIVRPQGAGCDIGAYESRGYTLAASGGDSQSAVIGTGFAAPLEVILSETGGSLLPGGAINFTTPGSGASASLSAGSATTNASGKASVTATANGTTGGYTIAAAAAGAVPVTYSLTNAAAPDTIIDSQPDNPLSTTTAGFTFHGTGGIASLSFQCSLDGSAFIPCTSPQTYNALPSGPHSFQVKALDSLGNTDPVPAGYLWKVLRSIGIAAVVTDGTALYTAAPGNGIWKSTDGGANWTAAASQPSNLLIMALVQKPGDSTTMYAGSYGNGVFKSVNASGDSANTGMVWTQCANSGLTSAGLNVVALTIDANKLYAGTEGGIYTSSDCATWTSITGNLDIDATKPPAAILIDAVNSETIYAGLDGGGIYKSINGGANWTSYTQPSNLRIKGLTIMPGDGTRLFAATNGGGVFKSPDTGATWESCATGGLPSLNVLSLVIDNSGKLYAGTEAGISVSTDGCATWTTINGGLP